MGRMRTRGIARASSARRSVVAAAAVTTVGMLAVLAGAAPAMAGLRNDLKRFSNCPYNTFGVSKCVYSVTSSGEFKIGKSTVPITVPVIIQGGLNGAGELIPATSGETLSRSKEPVPGGLAGLGLGGPEEVFAVAELAGTASITNAVNLPLKTRLENVVLGENCYIGTNEEPLSLHLTYGALETTEKDHAIDVLSGTLEDHTFAAPGASGCTAVPLVGDKTVDEKEGLPSPSGSNAAAQTGFTEQVSRRVVKDVLPLPDFGRCVKLPGEAEGKKLVFRGAYTNSTCTTSSIVNEGHYEWVEGPGANKAFAGSSGSVTLETAGGKTDVKCSASTSAGEYTGPKTETETITLTGCETGPHGKVVSCNSSGAGAGEIKTAALEGSLDFIKENEEGVKPEVGLDLKPASGSTLLSYECGGSPTSVTGSLIAPITTVDKMSPSFKVTAKQSGGKQAVEAFEESAKDTLSFGGEAGALGGTQTQTNGESLEVKAEDIS